MERETKREKRERERDGERWRDTQRDGVIDRHAGEESKSTTGSPIDFSPAGWGFHVR